MPVLKMRSESSIEFEYPTGADYIAPAVSIIVRWTSTRV
jgi:hypothetical protein